MYVIFVVCVCVCVIPGVCVFVIFVVCVCYIRGVYVIFVLCARVYVYVCVRACVRAYIHTHAHLHTLAHSLMGEGVYVYMWGEECMHVCVCVCVWGGGVYVCVCGGGGGGVCMCVCVWSGCMCVGRWRRGCMCVGRWGMSGLVWVYMCVRVRVYKHTCVFLSQNHSFHFRYHNVYMQGCHSQQICYEHHT